MRLVTAAQMQAIEAAAMARPGITAAALMEEAGRRVALDVAARFPTGRALVLCGRGNNGGDGFVAARHLSRAGWEVTVFATAAPTGDGPAAAAWRAIPRGVTVRTPIDQAELATALDRTDVAIDALLGIGARGPARPAEAALIRQLNDARLPVFAVDIPSGLDPDTGAAAPAVLAFRTITFGLPKLGLVCGEGPRHAGSVCVEPLLFPADVLEGCGSSFETLTMAEARALLPPRPGDGHKGTFGQVAVVAGSDSMPGAAVLAGIGALRGGCGLVRMVVPRAVRAAVATHLPEAILGDPTTGGDHLESVRPADADAADALVIGPGLGTAPATRAALVALLGRVRRPAVLDADALNLLAAGAFPGLLGPHQVLTPHPGELGRLMGTTAAAIQADRWGSAAAAAARFGAVVVLKGAGTLVAGPGGRVVHVGAGNTAWARGGAGDVLAGLIGSLLAQGMAPMDAAMLGVFVHGMAADIHLRSRSARGALVREVAAEIPFAFRELESQALPAPAGA